MSPIFLLHSRETGRPLSRGQVLGNGVQGMPLFADKLCFYKLAAFRLEDESTDGGLWAGARSRESIELSGDQSLLWRSCVRPATKFAFTGCAGTPSANDEKVPAKWFLKVSDRTLLMKSLSFTHFHIYTHMLTFAHASPARPAHTATLCVWRLRAGVWAQPYFAYGQ